MGQESEKKPVSHDLDVRVIVLSKLLELNGRLFSSEKGNRISLGYFDFVRIDGLDDAYEKMRDVHKGPENSGKSWLSKAWEHSVILSEPCEDRINETIYHHPLYVVAYEQEAAVPCEQWRSSVDGFWEEERFFQFVTFVHFFKEQDGSSLAFKDLQNRVMQVLQEQDGQKDEVPLVLCYRSIDLSDMVVIWKSNHLPDALDRVDRLCSEPSVGDLHTICSFRRGLDPAALTGKIPYASFRFNIRSISGLAALEQELKDKWSMWSQLEKYTTMGTEDLNVVAREIEVRKLVELISLWSENDKINELFQKAFNESSTHIGTWKNDDSGRDLPTSPDNALVEKCKDISVRFNTNRRKLGWKQTEPEYSWVKAVSEQLQTLVNMSRLCVLDGFCYLMLQSINVFCDRAALLFEEGRDISPVEIKNIHKFIRGWGVLMEQAVRADGQFTANLGINPTLYHIPIGVMECDMAFIYRCMSFIRETEQDESEQCALFLMPRLCRRVKVEALLGEKKKEELLYIEIPLESLYDQKTLLPQLCHEVSHYIGESYRCRVERIRTYLWCAAALIAFYCDWYTRAAADAIFDSLVKQTGADTTEGREKMLYMNEMKERTLRAVGSCLKDSRILQEWRYRARIPEEVCGRIDLEKFWEALSFVEELCRECYADLAMIYLLELPYAEYLEFYRRELIHSPQSVYNALSQRAALVASIAWEKKDLDAEPKGTLKSFHDEVCGIIRCLHTGEVLRRTLPVEILQKIREYLTDCFQKIGDGVGDSRYSNELEEIRNIYNALAREVNFADENVQNAIRLYEAAVVGNPPQTDQTQVKDRK